jgi:hypothetical protein
LTNDDPSIGSTPEAQGEQRERARAVEEVTETVLQAPPLVGLNRGADVEAVRLFDT